MSNKDVPSSEKGKWDLEGNWKGKRRRLARLDLEMKNETIVKM
jgi:hypothetical protein